MAFFISFQEHLDKLRCWRNPNGFSNDYLASVSLFGLLFLISLGFMSLREYDPEQLDCGLGTYQDCDLGSPHAEHLRQDLEGSCTQLETHLSRDLDTFCAPFVFNHPGN